METQALGTVRCYDDLHAVMRARVASLQVTRIGLDDIVSLPDGYAAKLLTPTPMKKLGPKTMANFLEAIGVKLLAVVDDEAVERHASKLAQHRVEKARQPEPAISAEAREFLHAAAVKSGRRGGRKRAATMSPEERSRIASVAARAKWAQLSPRRRRGAIARLNAARKKKQPGKRKRASP